jgi:hypothetical protein
LKQTLRLISWLFYTKYKLTVEEVREAIVIEDGDEDINRCVSVDVNHIVATCRGLIEIDEQNRVSFVHETLHEFLSDQTQYLLSPVQLGKSCLVYLNFNVFDSGPCGDRDSLKLRLANYTFGRYAARFWADLIRGEGEGNLEVANAALSLVGSPKKRAAMLQLAASHYLALHLSFFDSQTLLHVIAKNGLSKLCKLVLDDMGIKAC